jgi:ABC-type nitrate/sulfonate/bicarbonate transport system substrate-binding protein
MHLKHINRRTVLSGGVATASLLFAPAILKAQGLRKVRLTLPWVAQGSTLYPQVAQQAGLWHKRGLDVDMRHIRWRSCRRSSSKPRSMAACQEASP